MNSILPDVQRSGIREFTRIAKEHNCMFLTLGEPDFSTPEPIKAAAKRALDENKTHYPMNNGEPFLLDALSEFESRRYGLDYAPDEIVVTIGATEALFAALFSVIDPGDEVIIPVPAFSLYASIVQLCRGSAVLLDTTQTDFQLTMGQLLSALSPRTKAIVLTSPNNPTGAVYTEETLLMLEEVLRERNIFVICDDVYQQLIYTDFYRSPASIRALRDRLIVVKSFSKPYAMTGWRIGYLMADKPVKSQIEKVHQYATVSIASFVQDACALALGLDITPMVREYNARRDYVYSRLTAMGLPCRKPEGAFYCFPCIKEFCGDSVAFGMDMIQKAGLALTPGAYFNADGYMRVSYCYSNDVLKEGMDRLEGYIRKL